MPTVATVKRLFAVSGNRCAFPKCPNALVDASGKVIGRICHIKAHSPAGPRFDAAQSDAERHAFENLVLLCPIHHDVVDADVQAYTTERLTGMKEQHEAGTKPEPEPSERIARGLIQNVTVEGSGHTVVISQNQRGGITAATVHVRNEAPEPDLRIREHFVNRLEGAEYHSRIELEVVAPYPPANLSVQVRSPTITRIELNPQRAGIAMFGHSGTHDGIAFTNLQSPAGRLLLEIYTRRSEVPEILWDIQ